MSPSWFLQIITIIISIKDYYNAQSQMALHPTGMALQRRVVDLDRYKPGGKRKVKRPIEIKESPQSAIRRKYRCKKAGESTEKDNEHLIREWSDIYHSTNIEPFHEKEPVIL